MPKYRLTLATLDAIPAATAEVEVQAESLEAAQDAALALDFDSIDIEWYYDNGQPVEWDDLGGTTVAVAE